MICQMPLLYENTDAIFKKKSLQEQGITIPWGYIGAFALGVFIGLPIGREILKTAAGITEAEIKRRMQELKVKRGLE